MISKFGNQSNLVPSAAPPHSASTSDENDAIDHAPEEFLEQIGLEHKWKSPRRWQSRLRKQRRLRRYIRELDVGKSSPLLWGAPLKSLDPLAISTIESSFDVARRTIKFPNEIGHESLRLDQPFEFHGLLSQALFRVHLAQIAPQVFIGAPPDQVWSSLDDLCQSVHNPSPDASQSPWHELLWQIEFPLTLAHQFPDLASMTPLAADAFRKLEQAIAQRLDDVGMLAFSWWSEHRSILAGWLRCARLTQLLGFEELSVESRQRLTSFYRNTLRATYGSGETLLVGDDVSLGRARIARLADVVLGDSLRSGVRRKSMSENTLGASSEINGMTLMQTGWKRSSTRAAIGHAGSAASIHLWRNQSILLGTSFPKIEIADRTLQPIGDWEVSCWHSDGDLQLLDLELKLEQDIRLDRTIVLAVEDDFLFIADALISRESQSWTYSLALPLAPEIYPEAESETREVYLRAASKIVSVAMPLAAPEWKAAPTRTGLEISPQGLTLHQSRDGRHLFAPLWIDLDSKRSVAPHTWRSLTVAQRRNIQSHDSAVGYRIRSGNQQWLVFRSFGGTEPYSVFSKHLACEFYLGRVESDHSITDLIQFK